MNAARLMCLAAFVCVASTSALAQQAETDRATGLMPASQFDTGDSVPATLSATDRMLVAVNIGGSGPYPFIVDTASENSVVARDLAETLSLPPSGRASILSVTSLRQAGMVDMKGVSFVPGKTHDVRAAILERRNIGAAGILGIDALRGQRVVLDFAASQLTIESSSRSKPAPSEIVVHGRKRLRQLVLADCTIAGVPVDVIVDSGSQVSLGNEALRTLLTTRKNEFLPIALLTVTGETQNADYTRADKLVIGSAALIGMPVAFADAYIFRRLKLTKGPALLLGMDALQMFERVSVDFQANEARFVLPNNGKGVAGAGPLMTNGRVNTTKRLGP
jgi:hypothetical protein